MTLTAGVRQQHLIRYPVLTFFLLIPVACVFAQSAAETDWRQAEQPGQCQGNYVDHRVPHTGTDPGEIDASADSIMHVVDHSTTLTGNIRLIQDNQQLEADFATIDDANEQYTAEGDVIYRQPGLLIRGERIEGSLFSGTAAIDSASFLMHSNRLRGTAARISRDDKAELVIDDGTFTTCEPGNNTWSISSSSVQLKTAEGYGVARDVTLELKDIPVAWFPYLRFPIDDRRQSGLLVPSVGSDSDGGTDIAIPYYFNLAPNYDATYTLRSLWKRGVMHEGEFRYMDRYSLNSVAGTYLPSDDAYDERDSIDLGQQDNYSEQDRWLFHAAHRGSYGKWRSAINYTSVSDIDYFRDLGNFTRTDSDFSTRASHGSSPALLRTGSLSYTGTGWQTSLDLRSFQSHNQNRRKQYEVLPRLSFSTSQRIGAVAATLDAQYTQFDKSVDGEVTGRRTVMDGAVSLPVHRPWGFVTPSLRIIHRDYRLDDAVGRDDASLTTTMASIDAGMVFERKTSWGSRDLLQTLEPRIQYLFADEKFQDDLPLFDSTLVTPSFSTLFRENRFAGYDRIGDENRISAGVTTRFLNPVNGRPLLTASAGQLFHFRDREVGFQPLTGTDLDDDTSPLFAEISTRVGRLSVNSAIEFDLGSGRSNRGLLNLRYRGDSDEIINFTYRMTDRKVQKDPAVRNQEETDISLAWPINEQWQIVGRWNYGWDEGQTIESLVGVEYNDCCWKARVVFRRNLDEPRLLSLNAPGMPPRLILDRRADSGIYFEFQLKGLASLGGRLDSLLQDAVPGYLNDR